MGVRVSDLREEGAPAVDEVNLCVTILFDRFIYVVKFLLAVEESGWHTVTVWTEGAVYTEK